LGLRGAERDFKKAIEINLNDGYTHQKLAFLLSFLGRHEEAIKEVKLARDLNPLAPRIRNNVGYILYFARRYEEALEELIKALEFDPGHAATYSYSAKVCRELGRYDESIAYDKKAEELEKALAFSTDLAITYARAGKIKEAREILNEIKEGSKKEYVSPVILAAVHGELGEYDIAFDLLEKGYAGRDNRMNLLKVDPIFDPLRSDPRFTALLKKIGLEK